MPVSVGIGPNKTLAKMASHYAKHYRGYRHCCVIDSNTKRRKALALYPIEEVWGIGRRYAERLRQMGVVNALQLADMSREAVTAAFRNVVILRTWRELNGEDCAPDDIAGDKRSILVSRSFDGMISDRELLKTHVANFAARCAEKLRKQNSVASVVGVFLSTNHFREDLPQCSDFAEHRFLSPTASLIDINKASMDCVDRMFRPGFAYKRAGVTVMCIEDGQSIQTNLLDFDADRFQKMRELDKVVDRINKVNGTQTIVLGAMQYPSKNARGKAQKFVEAMKHDHKSPCYTTRWSDIIELK